MERHPTKEILKQSRRRFAPQALPLALG